MATATLITPVEPHPLREAVDPPGVYRCACGQRLRMFGCGRHRIYLESGNAKSNEPVMNGMCPGCGRGLPGKNPS